MEITLQDVLNFINQSDLSVDDSNSIVSAINQNRKQRQARAKAQFYVGQKVKFYAPRFGRDIIGTIKKINNVNVSLHEEGTLAKWNVSPMFLKEI